ncbi:MAG: tetratricopeptide repeat protein, partial [Woeseiaceae bacterium]
MCLSTAGTAGAMTPREYFDDGNRLFRDDLYWAALLRYRQALESGVDTPLLHYNTGVAHYKAGQHVRARESLLRSLESPALRIASQYNLGLNAFAAGDFDDALKWFRLARDQQRKPRIAEFAAVAIARINRQRQQEDPILIHEEEERRKRDFANLEFRARV